MRRPSLLPALSCLALAAAACSSDPSSSPTTNHAVTTSSVATTSSVTITEPAPTFTNPLISQDFPDPDVLEVDGTYYAYATNFGSTNIQAARSTDLVGWHLLPDALPVLPGWARPGFTWAPEVTLSADGSRYLMYYTARHVDSERQCIGLAVADGPPGPFRPEGDDPFVCQLDEGGSIDAASFLGSDGVQYLLWKNDGNCCGIETWIYLAELGPDGSEFVADPIRLIVNDQEWEGDLVEAPTLVERDGMFHLFYSANSYAGDRYAIGHATAPTVAGPYTKDEGPWLATTVGDDGVVIGPGGQDVVIGPDGESWLVYHSWDQSLSYRHLNIDRLRWVDGAPVLVGPTTTPQPWPGS